MVNLLAVDSQTLFSLTTYLNIIWSGPLQIIICMYMLWRYIGVAALAGLGAMVVFVPLNVVISNIVKKLRTKKLKQTDSRVKATNDMLNGVKVEAYFLLK